MGVAADIVCDFVWDDFCDWYIELSKPALYGEDGNRKKDALAVLCFVLENALKLLHPFIPFVTEEIYANLPGTKGSIMVSDFPRYNSKMAYKKEAKAFEGVMGIIKAVRAMKKDADCPPSKKVELNVVTESKRLIQVNKDCIMKDFLMYDLFLVKIFIEDYLKDMRFSRYSKFCSWINQTIWEWLIWIICIIASSEIFMQL